MEITIIFKVTLLRACYFLDMIIVLQVFMSFCFFYDYRIISFHVLFFCHDYSIINYDTLCFAMIMVS